MHFHSPPPSWTFYSRFLDEVFFCSLSDFVSPPRNGFPYLGRPFLLFTFPSGNWPPFSARGCSFVIFCPPFADHPVYLHSLPPGVMLLPCLGERFFFSEHKFFFVFLSFFSGRSLTLSRFWRGLDPPSILPGRSPLARSQLTSTSQASSSWFPLFGRGYGFFFSQEPFVPFLFFGHFPFPARCLFFFCHPLWLFCFFLRRILHTSLCFFSFSFVGGSP